MGGGGGMGNCSYSEAGQIVSKAARSGISSQSPRTGSRALVSPSPIGISCPSTIGLRKFLKLRAQQIFCGGARDINSPRFPEPFRSGFFILVVFILVLVLLFYLYFNCTILLFRYSLAD